MHDKEFDEDELINPTKVFQTDLEFITDDIERVRAHGLNHECFQIVHPWIYDLNQVDLKFNVKNNLSKFICDNLEGEKNEKGKMVSYDNCIDAKVFWLTYFKSQKACSADEFFQCLKELCEINKLQDWAA